MEISILLTTYNHERFVRQALDSILMQKINVSYEIIVLDDASTDNTPEILKEYKKKYPQKITLYLRKTNSGAYPTKNFYYMLSKAKGRYLASIDGDDFWIDDLKIQKQYEFLEKHKEYAGCMTDVVVVDEENNKVDFPAIEKRKNSTYTLEDFRNLRSPGMTVSFFTRNYFDREECRILYEADRIMADVTSYMLCLLNGNIYQLNETTAAYRYVTVKGKGNFNSVHRGNIYYDYLLVRYWIRLENFMQNYDKGFAFVPMADAIGKITTQCSARAVFRLLEESRNKQRYLSIFGVHKLLIDSNYLLDDVKRESIDRRHNWSAFKNDRASIILFGAGAVAAEYIDKFAWQGNILFLVDNDKKKQNTSYKGFFIKDPEEILRYKQKNKVKILIVNREHEADIENQLQKMGIKDYYCYCSMQTRRLRNMIGSELLKKIKKTGS